MFEIDFFSSTSNFPSTFCKVFEFLVQKEKANTLPLISCFRKINISSSFDLFSQFALSKNL